MEGEDAQLHQTGVFASAVGAHGPQLRSDRYNVLTPSGGLQKTGNQIIVLLKLLTLDLNRIQRCCCSFGLFMSLFSVYFSSIFVEREGF